MEDVSLWIYEELMKLSTPKLIKQCKAQNLSTRGKKSDLVNRLITKQQKSMKLKYISTKTSTNPTKSTTISHDTKSKTAFKQNAKKQHKPHIKLSETKTVDFINNISTTQQIVHSVHSMVQQKEAILINIRDLSIEQCMDNFFNGYIRIYYNKMHQYPLSMIHLIYEFSGSIISRFDLYPKRYAKTVIDNGFGIKRIEENYYKNNGDYKVLRSSVYLIGCSNGYNFGVHSWRIRIHQFCNDYIGIISNINICRKKVIGLYAAPCDTYYYSIRKSMVCCGKNSNVIFKPIKCKRKFVVDSKETDIMKIELDCNNWKVSFYQNGKLLGHSVNITSNCIYYLAIECRVDHTMYTLLQ